MSDPPTISVVIPTYNRKKQLLQLLDSIISSNYPLTNLQIIVIDDASTDGTFEALGQFRDKIKLNEDGITVIRNQEEMFVSGCRNLGIEAARGDYILFVDDDLVLDPNAIMYLIEFMRKNKNVGLAGPVIYYLNEPDTIWCAGIKINRLFTIPKCIDRGKKGIMYNSFIMCDAMPSPFVVRRECTLKVRFDDIVFKTCNEDIDFCMRISGLGYKTVVVPWAKVWHNRSSSTILYELFNIKRPELGYFLFRNSSILCRKLNKRTYIFVISLVLTLMLNLVQISIITPLTHNRDVRRNIVRGLVDGFRLAVITDIVSY